MEILPSLHELNFVPTLITSFSVTTSSPPISESGVPFILDLLRHFEPTSLPYSPATTHTSDHCHFGTSMPSLIGNASITALSNHTPVYTISEPRVRVTPLVTTMLETCVPFTFISTVTVSAPLDHSLVDLSLHQFLYHQVVTMCHFLSVPTVERICLWL